MLGNFPNFPYRIVQLLNLVYTVDIKLHYVIFMLLILLVTINDFEMATKTIKKSFKTGFWNVWLIIEFGFFHRCHVQRNTFTDFFKYWTRGFYRPLRGTLQSRSAAAWTPRSQSAITSPTGGRRIARSDIAWGLKQTALSGRWGQVARDEERQPDEAWGDLMGKCI